LGIATVSAGQAVLATSLPSSGARSLRAHYSGDSTYLGSEAAPVAAAVIAGASLGFRHAVDYSAGGYLGATVAGDLNGDGKTDLVVTKLGGVSVLIGNGNGTFQAPVSYSVGNPIAIAVGDFNGDGKPDIAATNSNGADLSVLLGNGDGTFQAAVNYGTNGYSNHLVVGDFNRDGALDIATALNGVHVYLGNGDGSFRTPVNYSISASLYSLALADFNGDGAPDLAVGTNAGVCVLAGSGSGTFPGGCQTIYSSTVGYAYRVFPGDFNGDGKADLAVESTYGSVVVLIGNGDGSFQAPTSYSIFSNSQNLAIGDFNGDGFADLVTSSSNYSNTVQFLFGNGDGTFQAALPSPPLTSAFSPYLAGLAVGEFNGDGVTDIAVADYYGSVVHVLLGGAVPDMSVSLSHGAGLTQGQTGAFYTISIANVGDLASYGAVGVTASLPNGVTATAIAGDGWTCNLVSLACARSDSAPSGGSYPPIKITVNVAGAATGSATAIAVVSGGGDVNPANSTVSDTTIIRFATFVTLSATPNPATLGSAVTMTANVTPGATGKVTFYDGVTVLGVAALTGTQATFATKLLPSGTRSLRARYVGDSAYGPGTSAVVSQTVNVSTANGVGSSASYRTGSSAQALALGDFNRDGKLDLVTTYSNSGSSSGGISVLLGNTTGGFGAALNYAASGSSSPAGLITGDFNGDGQTDVVLLDSGLYMLLGNGDGSFQSALKTNGSYYKIVAADLDGDGNLDLAALNGNNLPVVLLGNGDGTFQAPLIARPSGAYAMLSVADMNGDGKPDLVLGDNNYSPQVTVLLGVGDGSFQQPIIVAVSNAYYPNSMVTGDFNGDGRPDVAVVFWSGVALLPGNGDGTLGSQVASNLSGTPGNFGIAGDFNGDGKLDIGYAGYYTNQFYLAFGKGDGTFQGGTALATDGYSSVAAAADFNGDGRPDLAVANSNFSSINVFLGSFSSGLNVSSSHTGNFIAGGTGAYQLVVTNPSFTATSGTVTLSETLPAGLTATSMVGSGWTCTISTLTCVRSDSLGNNLSYPAVTLSVNVSASLSPTTLTNRVSVRYSTTTNSATDVTAIVSPTTTSLAASPNPAVLGQPVTLTATVSGGATGYVEFIDGGNPIGSAILGGGHATLVTRSLGAGARSLRALYVGDATHGLSGSAVVVETVTAGQSSGLNPGASYTVGTNPKAIVMADFNGDGKVDLVTANSGSNNVSVLAGNGNGTFAPKVDYAVGGPAVVVVAADFNNDGNLDLAVAVNATTNNLAILLGNGNGTFQQPVYLSLATAPGAIAAADFDLDGKADLVLGNSNELKVLLGNGDGTFQTPKSTGYSNFQQLALGDFNGDGKPDVAGGSYGINVLPGNGDGTFQSGNYSSGNCTGSISAGDINGDGKTDLVCTDYNNGVSIFLGRGDGTFQSYVHYSTGASTAWALLADVNGDGKLDVVATINSGSTIVVLLGNGDGTLQSLVSYTVGSQPSAIAAGDLNGDGRTDLAVANSGSNNVSVLIGVLTPVVSINAAHKGSYYLGQMGAVFTITVTNNGPGVTSGTVTVTDTLPTVFTAVSINGTGWACTLSPMSCTRTDSLATGASYPTITVTVNVASVVISSPVLNLASVSGGGSPSAISGDSIDVNPPPVALRFIPVTPCRVVDTRNPTSAFGGPILSGGVARTFTIPASSCGIPSTAQAYSLNLAVVPPGPLGFVTVWPAGQSRPQTSNLNSLDGRVKSNAVIVSAGASGAISVYASDTTHAVLDINGYFVPATDPNGLAFYPVTPCRIADTRNPNSPLGGPALSGGSSRTLPVQSSTCNIPASARAYSLNFTAVPRGPLGFLATWPSGQSRPLASTLNALTGAVTANAAIVPAGTAGSIDLYTSETTDMVIDINGYFAPAATGGLSLYNVAPCRVMDTRGSGPAFSGAINVNVSGSGCGIPVSAQAFVFSAVVVPPVPMGFLTLWSQGQAQPFVSTLNAVDGAITSNLAIVPAAAGGSISAYANSPTHLILDIFGYLAP
jgi:hypothetical protein